MERVTADETSNQTPVGEQTLDHHLRAKTDAHLLVSGANHFPLQPTQTPNCRDLDVDIDLVECIPRCTSRWGFHLVELKPTSKNYQAARAPPAYEGSLHSSDVVNGFDNERATDLVAQVRKVLMPSIYQPATIFLTLVPPTPTACRSKLTSQSKMSVMPATHVHCVCMF